MIFPPPDFASGNVRPKAADYTVQLNNGVTPNGGVATDDGQLIMNFPAGAAVPRHGADNASVAPGGEAPGLCIVEGARLAIQQEPVRLGRGRSPLSAVDGLDVTGSVAFDTTTEGISAVSTSQSLRARSRNRSSVY